MAQAIRAILLASATAATLIGRRSIRRASQGRFVPCWRAYRMTAIAPATSSQRKCRFPCFEILPSLSLPPVERCLDRYRVSFLPQQRQYQCMIDNDDIRLHSDEFAGIEAGTIGIAAGPTKLHPHVTAVDPSQLLQPLLQGRHATLSLRVVLGEDGEHADPARLVRLLRARIERPRRRAAEQRDELTAFYLIELHSIPASQGRNAGYRIGEDQAGDYGTIFGSSCLWRGLFLRAFRFA